MNALHYLSITESQKDEHTEEKILSKKDNLKITIIKQKNENREIYYNQIQQEDKSFIENLRYVTSDYNLLHLILFSIIAAPFLLVIYYIVKSWLTT